MEAKEMTRFKALFIKSIRVNQGYTWRAVQRELSTRYEHKKPFNSMRFDMNVDANQIDGMNACFEAMQFLDEKTGDGWN